ncbi:hypothetical protein DDZ15_12710 [Rhodohalobacter mucosus]|uniref:Uncharacterized protein n=1 Tax=Rhodohalobacter mucosus TaxID=2079485 RepID=A0A316TUR6_9BACT|nr:hypothetical protein DDZ15_12710 [Rhodohalobacter mucosus]
MKIEKKTIFDAIGLIAIVGSLIFVGLQVRQGTIATKASTVAQLKDSWVQLNLIEASNPDLAKAWLDVRTNGFENASPVSQSLVSGFIRTLMHTWSNAYYHHRIGTLDEEQWNPVLREMQLVASNKIYIRVWNNWKFIYDEPFRIRFDQIISENSGSET